MNIASILRHWFTLAATVFTAWLFGLITFSTDEQGALTQAVGSLVGPLVIIFTLIVTALWRMALTWAAKVFRSGSGENDGDDQGGKPGGVMLLLIAGTTVGMGCLPSCSQFSPPVGIAVEGPGYTVSYQFAK